MNLFNLFKRKVKPEGVEERESKIKSGLALGSGGTRGFAHLGVLKAFEDEGIKFDYVAGTSAGSIAGALYAGGYTVTQMIEFISRLSIKDVKNSKIVFMPSSSKPIENVLKGFMGDIVFSDLKRKFACVTVDLITGKEVVLTKGSVARAVSASCSVPPFYRPVEYEDMHLIDGAFANPIPANVVRSMGADVVVSVEVNSARGAGTESLNIIDVYRTAVRIAMRATADEGIINSDIMLAPNLNEFKSFNIKGANEMIKLGYDCAYEKMAEIKKLLGYKNPNESNPKGAPSLSFLNIKMNK